MARDISEAMRLFDALTPDEQEQILHFMRLLKTDPAAARRELERITGKRR